MTPSIDKHNLVKIQKLIEKKALESLRPASLDPGNLKALGLDAAYSRRYGGVAAAVLVDHTGAPLEQAVALGEPPIPYIPGLLAFREAPLLYTALQQIHGQYDVVFVDGHGISHPRHTGIATHIGLALAKPTRGGAKKRLYGVEKPLHTRCEKKPCTEALLVDPATEDELAAIIRVPTGSRIYVSPGAYITLEQAVEITTRLLRGRHPLPAPTYHADKLSKRIARALDRGALTPAMLKQKGLTAFTQ